MYLVVPRVSIKETKQLISNCVIHQAIYIRQRVCVIRTNLVKVNVVYIHSPFVIRFLDHYFVSNPSDVCDRPEEVGLVDLVGHYCTPLFIQLVFPLSNWFGLRKDNEFMTHEVCFDVWHVSWTPCKQIGICDYYLLDLVSQQSIDDFSNFGVLVRLMIKLNLNHGLAEGGSILFEFCLGVEIDLIFYLVF